MRALPLIEAHAEQDSCVRRVPIFARLDRDQQDAVGTFARPVDLARDEVLYAAGDAVGQLFVVHTGQVRLVHRAASGRHRLLRVAGPGDVVGEHAFLTGARPDHHAEALTAARLCTFAHADLARLVATYPAIALAMMRSLSDRVTDAERRLSLAATDVGVRVATYLLELPFDVRDGVARVRLPLPKKELASYLGTTPESFSRTLNRLQKAGLIAVSGVTIDLLDPDGLDSLVLDA